MAQHELHGAKIASAVEQVCGKAVPQHVGLQCLSQSGFAPIEAQKLPEVDAVQFVPIAINKKIPRSLLAQNLRPGFFQVGLHDRQGPATYRHQPLFISLSDATQGSGVRMQVIYTEAAEL